MNFSVGLKLNLILSLVEGNITLLGFHPSPPDSPPPLHHHGRLLKSMPPPGLILAALLRPFFEALPELFPPELRSDGVGEPHTSGISFWRLWRFAD